MAKDEQGDSRKIWKTSDAVHAEREAKKAEQRKKHEQAKESPVKKFEFRTKFEDWMPEVILKVMSRGGSLIEAAADCGVSRETIHNWKNPNSKFYIPKVAEAVSHGTVLSQKWWERNGRKGLWGGKEFNSTAFVFQMKNRFRHDYADNPRVEVEISASNPLIDAITKAVKSDWAKDEEQDSSD